MEGSPMSDAELRREARRIADDVREHKFTLPDGSEGWISYDLTSHDSRDGKLIVRGKKGVYCGQLGIAIYFAGMYNVFGDEQYRRTVRDSVEYLLEEDVERISSGLSVGVGKGVGSLVYGFSVLAELTGEERYRKRAHEFASTLTTDAVREDDDYDVLLGTAGALVGLLRLYEQSGDSSVLDKAVECGNHLLDNRADKWGYEVWDTHVSEDIQSFTTGFAHGAAGISYALYRLYGHTRRSEFERAAEDAIKFENVFYSERESNWKANWSLLPDYPLWWCYGTPGIGLGRIGCLEHSDSEEIRRDVDRAEAFEPRLKPRDPICHGVFSQIEFLVELGRKSDEESLERARRLATRAIERKRQSGSYRVVGGQAEGLYNPSLFLGTAGIGYTILRLLAPNDLPSVLRFE